MSKGRQVTAWGERVEVKRTMTARLRAVHWSVRMSYLPPLPGQTSALHMRSLIPIDVYKSRTTFFFTPSLSLLLPGNSIKGLTVAKSTPCVCMVRVCVCVHACVCVCVCECVYVCVFVWSLWCCSLKTPWRWLLYTQRKKDKVGSI